MARLIKLVGLASVYLMVAPCSYGGHGFSIIPNNLIPNPFAGLLAGLTT
jgi:hypothetical protein